MCVSMTHERSSLRQRRKGHLTYTKILQSEKDMTASTENYIYMNDFEFISSILKGTVCDKVGKGGLTIWIGFGKKIKINEKEKHTYYLVIQTPWRFLQDKKNYFSFRRYVYPHG